MPPIQFKVNNFGSPFKKSGKEDLHHKLLSKRICIPSNRIIYNLLIMTIKKICYELIKKNLHYTNNILLNFLLHIFITHLHIFIVWINIFLFCFHTRFSFINKYT